MAKTVNAIHKQRTNTAANWAAANPVLLAGQLGVISDTSPRRMKVGDGVTAWNSLPFVAEIPGIVSIDANKILGSNSSGTGYEFKDSVSLIQVISLLHNDEVDSSEVTSSTAESAALKTLTLLAAPYAKIIVEIIVQSRVEQSANTKCDFTYRIKYGGVTQQSFVDRIIASSTSGIVSGGRNTTTFSCIIDGDFPITQDITVTAQNSLSNANTGSKIRAFRVYAVTDASLMRGADGNTPYIYNNYWWIGTTNTGTLALGGINAGNTISFTEAVVKDTIISGETIGVLFGKLKKWFSSFGALAWKNKASFADDVDNKPTTIEGYGITNAYTKTEVDDKIPSDTFYYSGITSSFGFNQQYSNYILLLSQNVNVYFDQSVPAGKSFIASFINEQSSSINIQHSFGILESPIVVPAGQRITIKMLGTGNANPTCIVLGRSTIL